MRRAKVRLTDLAVRNLKPRGARRQVQDADIPGFGVLVNATGLKTFFYRYQFDGSEYRFRIGSYPAISLLPRCGTRKMKDIRRREIIDLLEDVADGKGDGRRKPGQPAPISANRLAALISRLFTFALDREVIDTNPAHRLPRPGTEKAKDRVLSEEEIRVVWSCLADMAQTTAVAWRLILLTGQRPGEVSRMRWEDLRQEPGGWTWVLPQLYMKNPLLPEARQNRSAPRPPLTPGPGRDRGSKTRQRRRGMGLASRSRGKRLANLRRSNRQLLDLTGIEPRFTPHDLQRTASTFMQKLGVDPAVIDRIQDHLDNSSVRATYQRHGYAVEMRRALALLGNQIEAIVSGLRGRRWSSR